MDEYLERPQARLAYNVDGDGDRTPAVVAHSFLASRHLEDTIGIFDWRPVRADGHRLIRFDSRGHGESSGVADEEGYRWAALADDLLAVLDAAEPTGAPVDAIAESTGCGTLLWAAVRKPERFRRLVLVIPPTIGEARHEQAQIYLAGASLIELRGAEAWKRLVDNFPPVPLLDQGGWARARSVPVSLELLPSVLRGAAASDMPSDEQLAVLQHPALVLAWRSDPNHPDTSATHLAEALPHGTVEIAEEPDDVRGWGDRVARFLAED
ncbi:MAG TPA: alpha/beta hydrolase [Amnibacterium sp.]|uniref:alpha/beta fold hydrolase n=1 Tax=Amnibacterium sp. TaxID=1872496 RepID=UPI002F926DF8